MTCFKKSSDQDPFLFLFVALNSRKTPCCFSSDHCSLPSLALASDSSCTNRRSLVATKGMTPGLLLPAANQTLLAMLAHPVPNSHTYPSQESSRACCWVVQHLRPLRGGSVREQDSCECRGPCLSRCKLIHRLSFIQAQLSECPLCARHHSGS